MEKSLASDSTIAVQVWSVWSSVTAWLPSPPHPPPPPSLQSACVRGLLYVCEDPNSSIVPLVASTLTKYVTSQLANFTR